MPGIDVEKLSEEDIKELVTNWASGHKIKYLYDSDTGKEEPHVLMHSLTPNLPGPGIVLPVKEKNESNCSSSGQTKEVKIY